VEEILGVLFESHFKSEQEMEC